MWVCLYDDDDDPLIMQPDKHELFLSSELQSLPLQSAAYYIGDIKLNPDQYQILLRACRSAIFESFWIE